MRRALVGVGLAFTIAALVIFIAMLVLPQPNEVDDVAPVAPMPSVLVDPYDVWLSRAPAGAPELSRDEAIARAALGCGQAWPPGTVDAVLAEVYRAYVAC